MHLRWCSAIAQEETGPMLVVRMWSLLLLLLLAPLSACRAKPDVAKWTSNSPTTGFTTRVQASNPTKRQKSTYKHKRCFCAGTQRDLKCTKKVLTCSANEAVQHCMEPGVFRASGVSLHPKNVAACICPCIKPAKRHECVCPIYNEFIEALTAHHRSCCHH